MVSCTLANTPMRGRLTHSSLTKNFPKQHTILHRCRAPLYLNNPSKNYGRLLQTISDTLLSLVMKHGTGDDQSRLAFKPQHRRPANASHARCKAPRYGAKPVDCRAYSTKLVIARPHIAHQSVLHLQSPAQCACRCLAINQGGIITDNVRYHRIKNQGTETARFLAQSRSRPGEGKPIAGIGT